VKVGGAWFLCDDSWVLRVDEATACNPSAYLLFYRQEGQPGSPHAAGKERE
jgi:ubiquitin C-terminal hydrolase